MSIITKLGIKPIGAFEGILSSGLRHTVCMQRSVRELEQQRNEMLEALIDQGISDDKKYGIREWKMVEIIEKATGKSWEEIKQIVDKER